jgi:hypothetical protein
MSTTVPGITVSWPTIAWNTAQATGIDGGAWPNFPESLPPVVFPTWILPAGSGGASTQPPLGAILGAVFGGLFVCVAVVTVLVFRRRRRRRRADMSQINPYHEAYTSNQSPKPTRSHSEPRLTPGATPIPTTVHTKLRVPAPTIQVSPSTSSAPSGPSIPSPAPPADLRRDSLAVSHSALLAGDAQSTPAESRQVLEAVRTLQTYLDRQPRDVEEGRGGSDVRTPSSAGHAHAPNIPPPAYEESPR